MEGVSSCIFLQGGLRSAGGGGAAEGGGHQVAARPHRLHREGAQHPALWWHQYPTDLVT